MREKQRRREWRSRGEERRRIRRIRAGRTTGNTWSQLSHGNLRVIRKRIGKSKLAVLGVIQVTIHFIFHFHNLE